MWFLAIAEIIILSLSTRTMATVAHYLSWVPISKLNTDAERRPISAADDLAYNLSALVGNELSKSFEAANA